MCLESILSVITVIGTILVPWCIMHKQNKISVYDKRFAIYDLVVRIIEFGIDAKESVDKIQSNNLTQEQLEQAYFSLWCNQYANLYTIYKEQILNNDFKKRDVVYMEINNIIQQQCITLGSARFLFDKKLFDYIESLRNKYRDFIGNVVNVVLGGQPYSIEKTNEFINFVVEHQDKLGLFDKYLMLEKNLFKKGVKK